MIPLRTISEDIPADHSDIRIAVRPADRKTAGSGFNVGSSVLQVAARLATSVGSENRLLLITSYDDSDGASDLAAQLAIGLARISQARVALVDGNRTAPALDTLFSVANNPGFGELIGESAKLAASLHEVADGVSLIPAGSLNGSLPMPECARVCDALRASFRYVVIAAGPLLRSPEAVTLSSLSDGVVLVLRAGLRHRDEVRELQRELIRLRVRLLGAVIREGKSPK